MAGVHATMHNDADRQQLLHRRTASRRGQAHQHGTRSMPASNRASSCHAACVGLHLQQQDLHWAASAAGPALELDFVGFHWIALDYVGLRWITLDCVGLHLQQDQQELNVWCVTA